MSSLIFQFWTSDDVFPGFQSQGGFTRCRASSLVRNGHFRLQYDQRNRTILFRLPGLLNSPNWSIERSQARNFLKLSWTVCTARDQQPHQWSVQLTMLLMINHKQFHFSIESLGCDQSSRKNYYQLRELLKVLNISISRLFSTSVTPDHKAKNLILSFKHQMLFVLLNWRFL